MKTEWPAFSRAEGHLAKAPGSIREVEQLVEGLGESPITDPVAGWFAKEDPEWVRQLLQQTLTAHVAVFQLGRELDPGLMESRTAPAYTPEQVSKKMGRGKPPEIPAGLTQAAETLANNVCEVYGQRAEICKLKSWPTTQLDELISDLRVVGEAEKLGAGKLEDKHRIALCRLGNDMLMLSNSLDILLSAHPTVRAPIKAREEEARDKERAERSKKLREERGPLEFGDFTI